MFAGWLADHMLWIQFYSLVGLGCIPAIFLLKYAGEHFQEIDSEIL